MKGAHNIILDHKRFALYSACSRDMLKPIGGQLFGDVGVVHHLFRWHVMAH